jgi:hypothetical protein
VNAGLWARQSSLDCRWQHREAFCTKLLMLSRTATLQAWLYVTCGHHAMEVCIADPVSM